MVACVVAAHLSIDVSCLCTIVAIFAKLKSIINYEVK